MFRPREITTRLFCFVSVDGRIHAAKIHDGLEAVQCEIVNLDVGLLLGRVAIVFAKRADDGDARHEPLLAQRRHRDRLLVCDTPFITGL